MFSLYINDVGCLADNMQGAVTGASDVRVTRMLYADDMCLTANDPTELQFMPDDSSVTMIGCMGMHRGRDR
eukprot:695831-Pelagomonas_calceolata.AAC.1